MFGWFKKKEKTPEEKKHDLEDKINKLKGKIVEEEAEVKVLWEIEKYGGYVFGKRDEIIDLEVSLARKKIELMRLEKELDLYTILILNREAV